MTDPENKKENEKDNGISHASLNSLVSLVADPFALPNVEIAEAQEDAEPLNLDEILDEEPEFEAQADHGTLDRLADVISEQVETDRREAEEIVAQAADALAEWAPDAEAKAAQEAATQLAAQIAEDQALQAQLAREAEEAEKADPELQAALPQVDEDGNLDLAELQSCIEAVLFMVDKPLSMDRIREMIGPDFELNLFQEAMTALMDRYKANARGIEIAQVANGYQFRTKPARAALAKKLAKVQTQRLSSGAMETLAIVAYRQPVMKEDIDKVRGVDSSYFVRHLLDKKLISISGRSDLPGRPMLYGTTSDFLSLFGLKDLSAMPSLREIEQMIPTSQSGNPDDEDPRVKEMRKLVGQMKADTSTTLVYDPREDEKILREIREKVSAIPTSTPYLEEQRALEKQAAELAKMSPEERAALAAAASIEAAAEGATAELPLEAQ